jgi:hypothetical protein
MVMVLWMQFGPYCSSPFPNDQSVRSASVSAIQTSSFRTPDRACKSSQILRKRAFFVCLFCFFRHVSLANKSRDTVVILFEIAARCTFSLRRSALVLAPPKQRIFDNALGSPCAAPQSRTGANGLTECARQMARIEKPAGAGNLRESFIGS